MSSWKNMHPAGLAVVAGITALFLLSLILLFYVYARYRRISRQINNSEEWGTPFLRGLLSDFAAAYKRFGNEANTPAVITGAISSRLGGLLFVERFLNNAVSLFVTLGLFGTFLGLSLSVSSLTELISYSNTSEWLSVLDSVGGGLMSALSGMGVAFYTSLVGVACSILLTILRSIFSPQAEREKLAVQAELWLDHTVAPSLPTDVVKDETALKEELTKVLNETTEAMDRTLKTATADLSRTIDGFDKTVQSFNGGVRDFSEFDYQLRGTVERLDVSLRDLVAVMKATVRSMDRKEP